MKYQIDKSLVEGAIEDAARTAFHSEVQRQVREQDGDPCAVLDFNIFTSDVNLGDTTSLAIDGEPVEWVNGSVR